MKRLFLLPAFLLFSHTIIHSQGCLPEGITFTSQEQIDNFQTNYPGCTEIEGNVIIGIGWPNTTNITSLNNLSALTSIWGDLEIMDNPALTDLSGLENLDSVGGSLFFNNNDYLNSFAGLNNLSFIGGNLWIDNCASLNSFEGFNNLFSIGGSFSLLNNDSLTSLIGMDQLLTIGSGIIINENNSLINFSGLENLNEIGGELIIHDNPLLADLSGLDNINYNTITEVYIYYNNSLSNCDVSSICEYLLNTNSPIEIYYNAIGCNDNYEVQQACLTSVEEIKAKDEITLFPNPATSYITININGGQPIEEAIIYNHLGQKALVAAPVNNTVDVSKLKPGIYILEVKTENRTIRELLLVE